MYCRLKDARGFTLPELMISICICFIIFSALIQIYLSAQKNMLYQADLNTIQEGAQQALMLLESDIHKAGFIGCARLTESFPITNHTNSSITSSSKIIGDTSSLTIRFMNTDTNSLLDDMQEDMVLVIPFTPTLHRGDVMMVSDCQSAEIFTIASIRHLRNATVITCNAALEKQFQKIAELGRLIIKTYSIRNTGRTRQSGVPIFALYSQLSGQHPNELVEGIDAMSFHYDQAGIQIRLRLSGDKLKKEWFGYANIL